MEITIEAIEDADFNYSYDAYNVYVESHRILTIATYCDLTASMWLKDALKTTNSPLHSLIVGVSIDRQTLQFSKNGFLDAPYQLLQLCIGSHCLLYHLPEMASYPSPKFPKFLHNFFSNTKVIAVAMNMEAVARKLEREHGIKFANPVGLNGLAEKGLKRHDLDLGRYDLDRLAKTVLGKRVDVVRPEGKVEWYNRRRWWYDEVLRCEKVKYATVDPYLCFLIGSELLEMINIPGSSSSSSSSKKKKDEDKGKGKGKKKK